MFSVLFPDLQAVSKIEFVQNFIPMPRIIIRFALVSKFFRLILSIEGNRMKKSDSVFSVFTFLLINTLCILGVSAQTQTDIPSPTGGEFFGRQVETLPNGNFVVTDPNYDAPGPITDVGRVYLYNGTTLALINTMTGTAANDSIGSDFSGRGITVLSNGDYVIRSSSWNGNRGAVTLCRAATGCPATISAANSLVGSAANNFVGGDGVTALPNGNYVVRSSQWDNGATANVGAITWCNGVSGCINTVSAANSRIGSTADDQIGSIAIIVLSNGNYVTQDVLWDNGAATNAGAITFCTGTAICAGAVSVANSLIGTTTNEFTGNQGVFPLTNGNYVVANDLWDNGAATDAGAATFCNGTTGCTATVSQANSLVGTTAGDGVGANGIAVLSNGNYVVRSGGWDNGGIVNAGAATFCNGTTGCTNMAVSTANSLHGSTANDEVGVGVTALTNGNYVVNSGRWDDVSTPNPDDGASTRCSGTTGCTGAVTLGNSLVCRSSGCFAVALTNGNYVVASQNWANPMIGGIGGAVTFCNGTTGCPGVEVSPANSLVGSTFQDFVGNVTPLTNGNYVVTAPLWDNGAIPNVGAATFCSGTAGCVGPVTTANSLTGTTAGDGVGGLVIALTGGGYVVRSGSWDNGGITDAGAVTRCGIGGCTGTVSAFNSLVGSTAGDRVGADFSFFGLTALPNGNYIVRSVGWDNGAITDAGAISYGFGNSPIVGALTVNNSVRGTTANGGNDLNFSFDGVTRPSAVAANNQLVVGRPADNIVTVFRPAAPTAASVSIGGRVLTAKGNGIAKVRVTLTDTNGETRTTLTNPFGYYSFTEVSAGETYVFSVKAKQFVFSSPTQIHSISGDTNDINFVAD